ncbi:hypothetical protein F444_01190 [Phytophthora nicotianae P1976]|uniref:PiggyBac transposable element-derived protein domain-containing protein n=1 Tax=Phytophthora nicotianae P1976 TaxID=1317066 RepID=A0A081B1C6_PHYNI|nr:hypothetical protein F444_01190 [Phytophthora nicotianae P1976]
MTCCVETAYCLRLAVYCGKAQHESELGGDSPTKIFADPNSDPSAVVRNLDEVLPPPEPDLDFTVVTDCFYTSVRLALLPLSRNVYSIVTIQSNMERKWLHRTPRIFLTCHVDQRRETTAWRDESRRSVPIHDARLSPLDGWGEIHDQLRLQRYSLQLSVVFRKYYKTIFLGLVDMTIVNTFTIYREACKQRNEPPADPAMFLRHLQEQRLELTASNFADILSLTASVQTETLGSISTEHKLTMFQDWNQFGDQKQHPKQPQHQCKVCSI